MLAALVPEQEDESATRALRSPWRTTGAQASITRTHSPWPIALVQVLHVVRQHLAPPGPVMVHVVPPEVQHVRDALLGQDFRKSPRCVGCLVRALSAHDDDPGAFPQVAQILVRQTRQ